MANKQRPYKHDPLRIRLRKVCDDRDIDMKTLAEITNVGRSTALSWSEGYRMPNAYTLRRVCEKLNVSADYLLGLTDVERRLTDDSSAKNKVETQNDRVWVY